MAEADEFDAVRREPDPAKQGQLATELLSIYQQRSVELARLRKEAISKLQAQRGLSYAAIAAEMGLSKGRIGQIRQTGPPVERAFFGTGPITVAVPLRETPGRSLPVISAEDTLAAERLTALLESQQFQVEQHRIPVDGQWSPPRDTVAICGPKSSPVTAQALDADPVLRFYEQEQGRWVIEDRESGQVFTSPMDNEDEDSRDIAYVGRLPVDGETLLIIAGVHALGSLGAVDYLTRHLPELYGTVGQHGFSMVVASSHDGETVTESEALCPPRRHT